MEGEGKGEKGKWRLFDHPARRPRLIVPRTRTELAKGAFSVAAPALWNSLPVDVVDTNTLPTFNVPMRLSHIVCPPSASESS